ncbi:MAG: NERD domain-containing protein [Ilumatobacteraceae bacterium]
MAQLIPTDFALEILPKSEQRVVRTLLSGLDESWIVVPSVPITFDGKDSEIDIVLAGFDRGAFVIEVKGGKVTVNDGNWKSWDNVIKNPVRQVQRAKHALIKRLKKTKTEASKVHLSHLVAFPDNADFPREGAGPECPRDIVLTAPDLDNIAQTLERIGHEHPATSDQVASLVKALRPDITDIDVDGRHVRGTVARLAEATADRLGPVIGLDENRRVYLRGSAGTGKTFVAMRWFRRALQRGESTLYACFNAPLAGEMEGHADMIVERLVAENPDMSVPRHEVANFHALMRRTMGEAAPSIPDGDPEEIQRYWNSVLPTAFGEFLNTSDIRFDTVIIDEAQDFRPEWLEIVESLMTDREDGRLYMMADAEQAIYASSWSPPSGITTLELTHNLRNSGNIAAVVSRLGGAPAPRTMPAGPPVDVHKVAGAKEAVKAVRKSLESAIEDLGVPLSQIAILVTHRAERDMLTEALTEEFSFVPWQGRDEDAIVCETVHRTKGLERQAVVLVNMDDEPDRTLVYVGASRASAYLSVVSRAASST